MKQSGFSYIFDTKILLHIPEWGRGDIGICYIWMTNVLFPSLGDLKNGCITNTEYFKSAVPKMPLKKILSHKSFQSLVFSVSKMCNNKCLTKSNIKILFLNRYYVTSILLFRRTLNLIPAVHSTNTILLILCQKF